MKSRPVIGRAGADLRSYHLAAVAVFLVGGAEQAVHTEDVAIKAYELAPHRFSWKKYPEKIDLEAVRLALRHASEPQYGSLVTGSVEIGWMLTPAGLSLAEKAAPRSKELMTTEARRGSHHAEMQAERARLLQTAAWHKFEEGKEGDISVYDFHSFARVNEYTSRAKYEERIAYLKIASQSEPDLATLIDHLDREFGQSFRK